MKNLLFLFFFIHSLFAEDPSSNSFVFSEIYEKGTWGKDASGKGNSGGGSDPRFARRYIAFLNGYLKERQIKSVVDLGCGDWRIGEKISWGDADYLGIDVASSVIEQNIKKYASCHISFLLADGSAFCLPEADLLICKDVLQHLPLSDIWQIVGQFHRFRHCMIVNDVDPKTRSSHNPDIQRGGYRPLDLTQPPFSLSGKKIFYAGGEGSLKCILVIDNF